MQLLVWNGVQRRNIPPGTPRWPPPAVCQEPVRSGLPLGSLGVGIFRRIRSAQPNRRRPAAALATT